MNATCEYLIEQLGDDGRWFVVGSDPASGWAQYHMRRYQADRPGSAFRVVEHPSRVLVVCHDERPETRAWVRQPDGSFIRPGTVQDALTLHHPDDDSEFGYVLARDAAEAFRVDRETFNLTAT